MPGAGWAELGKYPLGGPYTSTPPGAVVSRSLSDSAAVDDGTAATARMVRLLASTLHIKDLAAIGGQAAVVRHLTDTALVTDAVALSRERVAATQSLISILEDLASVRHRSAGTSSWAHIQEALGKSGDSTRVLEDANSIVDAVVRTLSLDRDLASTLDLLDSVVASLQGRISDVTVGDAVALMTVADGYASRSTGLVDSLHVGDELLMLLKGRLLEVSVSDSLPLLDDSTVARWSALIVVDGAVVYDDLIAALQGRIVEAVLADELSLGSAVAASREFAASIAGYVTMTDTALRSSLLLRLLRDSNDVSDAVLADLIRRLYEVLLADALGVTDQVAVELVQLLISWGVIETQLCIEPISTKLTGEPIVTRLM